MNNICKIVEDLLPLYVEDLVNEENTKLIDEHLLCCDKCKNLYSEMKNNFISEPHAINFPVIEDKALSMAKVISKYQNILKLSLCSVMILFAVVICSIPITFINTLSLMVFIPFICRLLYGRCLPLILVSFVCALIGGTIVAGSVTEGWLVALGQFLLMNIGIYSGVIFVKARTLKGNKPNMIIYLAFSLILLGLGFFINSSFSGNPVSYIKTYNQVSSYIKRTYSAREVKINGIFYTWSDGSYSAKISKGSELFSINLYKTGYIQDNYNMDRANTYSDNYAKMIQIALNSKFKGQYFWVIAGSKKDANTTLEQLVPTKDMDLIIRFTTSNEKTPPLKVMSQSNFLELAKNVVKELDELKLSYNNINFQAIDVDKKDMSVDLEKGLKLDSIFKSKN